MSARLESDHIWFGSRREIKNMVGSIRLGFMATNSLFPAAQLSVLTSINQEMYIVSLHGAVTNNE